MVGALAWPVVAAAADTSTTYDRTFEADESVETVELPDGIHRIAVTAIGGWGVATPNAAGGRPHRVDGVVSVLPLSKLHVVVGGNAWFSYGGFNGGGNSQAFDDSGADGGGGGGASDVRTVFGSGYPLDYAESLGSRLLVAAGGGGAGARGNGSSARDGGAAGDAGAAGSRAELFNPQNGAGTGGFGGLPGSPEAGGAGGDAGYPYFNNGWAGQNGYAGGLGRGGLGGSAPTNMAPGNGGGGGGGFYGGGGGGGGALVETNAEPWSTSMGGGGGGGGSSLVPDGGTAAVVGPEVAHEPSVRLRYTAPGTDIDGPSGPIATNAPSFVFTATEDDASFLCWMITDDDQQWWEPCASPATLSGLEDGEHRLWVRAVSPDGNGDPTPAEVRFVVDTVAPNARITAGPTGRTSERRPSFGFSADDPDATFACRVDDGAFDPCDPRTGYEPATPLADGTHVFAVRAIDAATNAGPVVTRAFEVRTGDADDGSAAPGPGGTRGGSALGTGSVLGAVPGMSGVGGIAVTGTLPARLRVVRARVRRGRLELRARATSRANGDRIRVDFFARGEHLRLTASVRDGQLRLTRRLTGKQRSATTGIVTLAYAGSAAVRPARVRLRVARRSPRIGRAALSLHDGRLRVAGTIDRRAHGIVRLRLSWNDGYWAGRAKISDGRWSLTQRLPAAAREGGYLTIQYTGSRRQRIHGAQDGRRVTGTP